jgi:hypothetical protein
MKLFHLPSRAPVLDVRELLRVAVLTPTLRDTVLVDGKHGVSAAVPTWRRRVKPLDRGACRGS